MYKTRARSNLYNQNVDKRGSEDVKHHKLIAREGNTAQWIIGLLMFVVVGGIMLQVLGFFAGHSEGINELS